MAKSKCGYICGRYFRISISDAWDGWSVGFLSVKIIKHPISGRKALRFVLWRLATWVEM